MPKRTSRSGAAGSERSAASVCRQSDENPIAWLGRRKDKDGRSLISEPEIAAAERLSADFWFAGMVPRVTTNWSAAGAGRASRRSAPGIGVEIQDHVIAAGERVRRALAAVGPELSGVLIDVCCHGKGLEVTERAAGWPKRTAKIILHLALTSLARHYGFDRASAGRPGADAPRVRHWGAEGYRPSIDGAEDAAS